MTIFYSKHARERMALRGISQTEVEEAIKKGSKELQKPDKISTYYNYFCVVYKKRGEDCFIITIKPW